MKAIRRFLGKLLRVGFLCAVLVAAWFAYRVMTPMELPPSSQEYTIREGSSLRTVANELSQAGMIPESWTFNLLGRLLGQSTDIKAGSYLFPEKLSPYGILEKITRGDVDQREITFIEGWTFRQMRKSLDEHPDVKHEMAGMSDEALLKAVGVEESAPEGLFFPNTYYFSKDTSDLSIMKRSYHMMKEVLAREWDGRRPGLPLATPYDALILASIIEKETGKASEREIIAGVFINRLRLGMKLQTDPTVIYGLGQSFDGNLRKSDLLTDQHYNTYTRTGLPPTPISLPGLASIRAALQPAETTALYFVARGDGSSQFSDNLDDHKQAVNQYQKNKGL